MVSFLRSAMVLTPVTSGDVTHSMMDSARVGLEYIVENSDYTQKLALGKGPISLLLLLDSDYNLIWIHSLSYKECELFLEYYQAIHVTLT